LQTRGNQREIDRARAQKRKDKAGVGKDKEDGLTPAQRKERCAAFWGSTLAADQQGSRFGLGTLLQVAMGLQPLPLSLCVLQHSFLKRYVAGVRTTHSLLSP
jgi:hypothetical protein